MTVQERQRAYPPPGNLETRGRKPRKPVATSYQQCLPAHEVAVIGAALQILTRYMCDAHVFTTPDAVQDYCRLSIGSEPREHFAVMFLDAQHRFIAFEVLFVGTLTQTAVYPREVVLRALVHNAASVVLTHNHPSGSVHPSRADELLTVALRSALALVDVRVLDHVIVSPDAGISMAALGMV